MEIDIIKKKNLIRKRLNGKQLIATPIEHLYTRYLLDWIDDFWMSISCQKSYFFLVGC